MAGDWIKFELTTLDKPEVCQIADLADIDPDAVVGKLMRVWGWFDQQTEKGNAPSVSKKLLDRLVGVTGFCEHMKSVAWMIVSRTSTDTTARPLKTGFSLRSAWQTTRQVTVKVTLRALAMRYLKKM
jgi:hypothetical protein